MNHKPSRIILSAVAVLIVAMVVQASLETVQGSTVTVTATVTESVTCSTNNSTAALGTLASNAIASTSGTGNASTSFSCNTGLGCTLTVLDAGNAVNPGLTTTSPAYIIGSASAAFADTATLVAGTEGYGIQATSTNEGSGGSITLPIRYSSPTYAAVGGLEITAQTLASSTAQVASRSVVVSHWAAISGTTQAGIYSDTITYSCTGN